jgi:hypothetical protein
MTEPSSLFIALIVANWSAFNVLASTQKQLNDMRNVIILGKVANDPISMPFRRHMLYGDWVPGWIAVMFLSFAFGLFILLAPLLVDDQFRSGLLWFVCVTLSLFPFFASFGWLFGGYADFVYIRGELLEAERVAR